MTQQLYLESERLVLRSFIFNDLMEFVAYRSEPEVARFQSWHHFDLAAGRAFLAEMSQSQPNQPGTWFQIALERKADACLLGDLAWFTPADDPRQAMIGYTLAPAYQGVGFATEALHRFLDYLFKELGKHRVYAITDTRNEGSINLLERLGFRREGHFVEQEWFKGAWVDNYHYALLHHEWSKQASKIDKRS